MCSMTTARKTTASNNKHEYNRLYIRNTVFNTEEASRRIDTLIAKSASAHTSTMALSKWMTFTQSGHSVQASQIA